MLKKIICLASSAAVMLFSGCENQSDLPPDSLSNISNSEQTEIQSGSNTESTSDTQSSTNTQDSSSSQSNSSSQSSSDTQNSSSSQNNSSSQGSSDTQNSSSSQNNSNSQGSLNTQNSSSSQDGSDTQTSPKPEQPDNSGNTINIPQTGMTLSVPAEYMETAENQANVVRIEYGSKDYVRDGSPVTKTAYVYLPYGYDESDTETRYDIVYLMHGWGGREGEYFDMRTMKNMFDNLIANGDMKPTIMVSATFYNENSDRSFGGSDSELRQFHLDFTENLMPAVEGRFHTYAQSTSKEDLIASRDHRAFAGFSLGSVTTWMEFCYDSEYIRYFLPMSGACWYYGGYGNYYPEETCDFFEELIAENDLNERGYFIYATTGTQDAVRDQVEIQMQEMLKRNYVFSPDHVVYYRKQGGYHDFNAVQEYLYNALPLFFGT